MQTYREILKKKFKEEYNKLNAEQQKAVDTIEGPVMVIAGPGTGKTQILAARIGKILLETDVSPRNILCLTYTDAGSLTMRKRLLQFIGPDAYKVNIYTFHAFCNDIIQEDVPLVALPDGAELRRGLRSSPCRAQPLASAAGDARPRGGSAPLRPSTYPHPHHGVAALPPAPPA